MLERELKVTRTRISLHRIRKWREGGGETKYNPYGAAKQLHDGGRERAGYELVCLHKRHVFLNTILQLATLATDSQQNIVHLIAQNVCFRVDLLD